MCKSKWPSPIHRSRPSYVLCISASVRSLSFINTVSLNFYLLPQGNSEAVEPLLQCGLKKVGLIGNLIVSLLQALPSVHAEVTLCLLNRGADVDHTEDTNSAVIFSAIELGDVNKL